MRAVTKLGALEGETTKNGMLVFRGIPYAAPPLGALRFRAPEPPLPWAHTRDARALAPTAPQILGVMRDLPPQDEDCLKLNVWTKSLTGHRPVVLFIHGGAFTAGSSAHTMYDGRELALRGDIVFVSFNYRLGVLGYLDWGALGELSFGCDANNGVRDQIAALRFVREHIDAFGGDPENVTIFGQSAGAMSACTLLAVPSARGLFRRAIAQSGGIHHTTTREHSARMAEAMLEALDLLPDELDKLRELPVETLVQAQAACLRDHVYVGSRAKPLYVASMTLIPVVDGELIPKPPIEAIANGEGADVPLLTGSNRDEQRFWTVLVDSAKQAMDQSALVKLIEKRMSGHGERLIAAYRARMPNAAPWELYSAIDTDRVFRVPAWKLAEARAAHAQHTYLYAFDFVGPLFEGQLGACHTIEVPFSLGLVHEGFGKVFTGAGPDARLLSDRMLDAWMSFARSGDPSTEALGEWPAYAASDPRAMRLGRTPGLQPALDADLDSIWRELI